MKLSSNEEYGLRCLVRLAREGAGGSLTIPEISEAEGVSNAYVAKLMRILRQGGLVNSSRGKIGGYVLARPAGDISMVEVMNVLGGRLFEPGFCEAHAGQMHACASLTDCSLRSLWRNIQRAVDEVLGRTTLQDLVRDATSSWVKAEQITAEPGPVSSQ